ETVEDDLLLGARDYPPRALHRIRVHGHARYAELDQLLGEFRIDRGRLAAQRARHAELVAGCYHPLQRAEDGLVPLVETLGHRRIVAVYAECELGQVVRPYRDAVDPFLAELVYREHGARNLHHYPELEVPGAVELDILHDVLDGAQLPYPPDEGYHEPQVLE